MNAKLRVLLIGGVVGSVVGALAGWIYYNTAAVEVDAEGHEHLPAMAPGYAVKLGLGLLGVLKMLSG
ncbi:MAG: hypothetical protein JW892_17250 [Anaerolineae bacterium]|nr:hypothetical protein [Anaerolineae bacterium]